MSKQTKKDQEEKNKTAEAMETKYDNLVSNFSMFQLALREGMGFSYACLVSGNDPKHITGIVHKNDTFKADCLKLVQAANFDLLRMSSEFMTANKYELAYEVRRKAESIKQLVLWESFCKKAALTDDLLVQAYLINGDGYDTATSVGLTQNEYVQRLAEDGDLVEVMAKLAGVKEKYK